MARFLEQLNRGLSSNARNFTAYISEGQPAFTSQKSKFKSETKVKVPQGNQTNMLLSYGLCKTAYSLKV